MHNELDYTIEWYKVKSSGRRISRAKFRGKKEVPTGKTYAGIPLPRIQAGGPSSFREEYGTVLLVIAYGKKEKDDLSPDEKRSIRQVIQLIEREFARGLIK